MNLNELGVKLEHRILVADQEAVGNGVVLSPKTIEIRVVGQTSLLADNVIGVKFELEQTNDFDAFVKATNPIKNRKLVMDAIDTYGDELRGRICQYGGNLENFKGT